MPGWLAWRSGSRSAIGCSSGGTSASIYTQSTIVPGHGATVGRGFVHTQHAELVQVADAARRVVAAGSADEVSTPYRADVSRIAFGRALAQSN